MNVILTTQFSPWSAYSGGGQLSTHRLATALRRRGHAVSVVYTKPPWESVEVPADVIYDVRWAVLPALRSRRDAFLRPLAASSVARRVRRLLGAETVVHGSGEEAARVPGLRRRQAFGFVLTPRFPRYPAGLPSDGSPLARAALRLREGKFVQLGRAVRGADLCCPTSRSASEALQRAYGVGPERLCVVPNGVPEVFLEVERRRDAHAGPVVFFGRLARSKGADVLVDALARLGSDGPEAVIIGRGEEAGALRRQAERSGLGDRVQVRGWMAPEELATLLARASVVVLPSREESFGNAMAEAMAAGAPVVSTRVGSIPELIDDGRTGRLVPVDDAAAVAEAIRSVRADPAQADALGRRAREHIRERFTWNAVAERYERIYRTVLSCALSDAPLPSDGLG